MFGAGLLLPRELRMARINVAELAALLAGPAPPLLLDVRPPEQQRSGRIPGAVPIDLDAYSAPARVAAGREVVIYCACPNEASAAVVARRLQRQGLARVRPLHGGIDAWIAAGHTLEN